MGNFFRNNRRLTPTPSAEQIATVVLSILSVIGALYVITNFDAITAHIAIVAADCLTSGFFLLAAILLVVYLVARLRWGIRRRFWGW